ncbi:GNAT family N-acetyltransferase [bacterium]|nr:GNAT family N-acetyltransferase [bacterium]
MNIQETNLNDWKVLQSLNNEVFIHDKEFDKDLDLEWPFSEVGVKYYKELADGSYGKSFIAEVDGEAVGYIALGFKDFGYRKGKFVELENMGVLPQYRSQGIGHILVEKAKEWSKTEGATKMYVTAYWQNSGAIGFYKKEGFEEIDLGLEVRL